MVWLKTKSRIKLEIISFSFRFSGKKTLYFFCCVCWPAKLWIQNTHGSVRVGIDSVDSLVLLNAHTILIHYFGLTDVWMFIRE